MTDIVISARDVFVSYGESDVLRDIDFECRSGEFVAIVGRSGTGKSTFLNALAGLLPYDGEIEMSVACGYVFQGHALFPWMTVAKNISFGIKDTYDRTARKARVKELLERIEMEEYASRYPSQLSGGQVQRVALARALAPDPEILLMDEPYGALDHYTRERMQNWLLSIWEESRKSVLFVTHYIEEAIFLADRVIVVHECRFVTEIEIPFARPRSDDIRFTEKFHSIRLAILNYMGG